MLTVTKLTGRAGDILAYAEGRKERSARGDYYLDANGEHERARVAWSPALARNALVGLAGTVDPEAFEAVMAGRDPRTGEVVITANLRRHDELADGQTRDAAYAHAAELGVLRGRRRPLTSDEAAALQAATTAAEASEILAPVGKGVAGHDLTFSAPKSISLAWALTTDGELRTALEAAHVAAARRALLELESRALVGRARKIVDGRRERVRVPLQWVGIEALHTTARVSEVAAREGRPPDPDIHTHAVIANMGWDTEAQRWRAVDAGTLLYMRSLGDGVYLTALAEELHRLGFAVQPNTGRDGRYIEVAGFESTWIEAFSSRAHEVRRARELLGIETDVAARGLAAATRRGKGDEAHRDHRTAWRHLLGDRFGDAALERVDALLTHRPTQEQRPLAVRERELLARFFGPEGLTAHEASHTAVAVEATLWHLNGGRLTAAEMTDLVPRALEDPRLVLLDDGRYTTGELLRQEVVVERAGRWLLETADPGRVADPDRVASAIASTELQEGVVLDREQRQAVAVLTDPRRRLSLLGGRAGTGKTTTMRAAREVWEGGGRQVLVVSVAAATAQRSAREIGAREGLTFEELERRRRSGQLEDARTGDLVVVVDEAAMADTPRLASLLSHAGDATVVLLGDERQLQAVGAGGGWLRLRDHAEAVGGWCELTQVHRQRYEWERRALDDVREGRGVEGVAAYRSHQRIRIADTRAEARRNVAEAWNTARLAGVAAGRSIADYVIVASTREDVDVLNEWAQGLRRRGGELGQAVELQDREGRETVCEGDRVRLEGRLDAEHPNGIRGTVVQALGGALRIDWDTGRAPSLYRPAEHAGAGQVLRLDYAATTQRTQGTTAEEAWLLPSPEQRLEALYSGLSRARGETTIWLDAKTWGERLSELAPEDRSVINHAQLVARLAVRAEESEVKRGALDAGADTPRRVGREARVEAARAKLEAMERAVSAVAAAEQPAPTKAAPSLEELAARVRQLRHPVERRPIESLEEQARRMEMEEEEERRDQNRAPDQGRDL